MREQLEELVRRTSTRVPDDVLKGLVQAHQQEPDGSRSKHLLAYILENLHLAAESETPLTTHTSSVHFFARGPADLDRSQLVEAAREAVVAATRDGFIEPHLVDPVTGKALRNNAGVGMPLVHFEPEPCERLEVRVLMKGNGAEGSGQQFALPDESISAPFSLEGVRRAVLEALIQIQGRGCGPGVVGVGVGGDRASGMLLAHRQLLRPLGQRARTKALAALEKQLLEDANSLGIGPLGYGGKATLLGVKVDAESAPRESCYVSVSYLGWAYRRQGVALTAKGAIAEWLYPCTAAIPVPALPVAEREAPAPSARKKATPKRPGAAAEKPAKKPPAAKKPAAKSSPAKEAAAGKSTAGKGAAKKSTAKKSTAKKSTAEKATAEKAMAEKATVKKATVKKSTVKVAGDVTARTTARAKKAAPKKAAPKKAKPKSAAKKKVARGSVVSKKSTKSAADKPRAAARSADGGKASR